MPPWTMPNSALRWPIELGGAALGPAQRQPHRLRRLVERRWPVVDRVRRALVKDHRDIGVEHALDAHRLFRCQEQPVAVDRGGKAHALFADPAQRAQREHLEAARVGEDRTAPAHETVQAAVRADDVETRTQPQVEGVAQHDLRAGLDEFRRRHGLDSAVGADRHEGRRVDGAVRKREPAAPRRAVAGDQFEDRAHGACSSSIASP
jgi:hypothetical protein